MRNLFALIGFAVVAFVVVGWSCGWYRLSIQKGEGGKAEIQTVVDTKKVTEDSTAFFHKLAQVISQSGQASPNPNSQTGSESDPSGVRKDQGGTRPGDSGSSSQSGTPIKTSPTFTAPPVSIPPFSGSGKVP